MCTAIKIKTPEGETHLGRTMDFSYPLDPELYIIPKGYQWNTILNTHLIRNQYNVMGIGQNLSPVILADGMNDMGFAAAALYFPGYASYDPVPMQNSQKPVIAALELVNFLLGQCATVEQAASMLRSIRIVGVKDPVTNSIAPLHWILADKTGKCAVAEKTKQGLHIMENPIGVLSNSPDFGWHMTNLRNFMNITPSQQPDNEWPPIMLTPFGQGAGTFGLPGDYTPPSRFVRTAYQLSHTQIPSDGDGAVTACFHILESVSIPKGIVMTGRGAADYTQYISLMNLNTGEYFFRTYDNSQITAVKMPPARTHGSAITSIGKLIRPIQFDEWS